MSQNQSFEMSLNQSFEMWYKLAKDYLFICSLSKM